MNIALLTKWLVRLRDPNVHAYWKSILISKYNNNNSLLHMSSFWKGLYHIKHIADISINWKLGDRKHINFLTDRWLGENSLATLYPNLFAVSNQKYWSVYDALSNRLANFPFKRQLVGGYLTEWIVMKKELDCVFLDESHSDILVWRWSTNGKFSVQSIYSWLEYSGVTSHKYDVMWQSNLPLKIKIFLWLLRKTKSLPNII